MLNLFAQKEGNNWCFADSVLLTFQGDSIQVGSVVIKPPTPEAFASISSSSGKLLFYADATFDFKFIENSYVYTMRSKLRTAKDSIIENSDSLKINPSATNGVLVLPQTERGKYYIFSLSILDTHKIDNIRFNERIYWHEANMLKSNGHGKVISKNNVLSDRDLTERLTSVRHSNGRDWWLIAHELQTNNFFIWLIDNRGINFHSSQAIGSINKAEQGHTPDGGVLLWEDYLGEITVNKYGNKLAYVGGSGLIEAFDFDRCTGRLSNPKTLHQPENNSLFNPYGCCLSPNGRFLYHNSHQNSNDTIFQLDLNEPNPFKNKYIVYNAERKDSIIFGQMELGPDGKIYIGNMCSTCPNNFLSVIHAPDSLGEKCRFEPKGLKLGNKRSRAGLPNMPNYNLGAVLPIAHAGKGDSICRRQSVRLGTPPVRAGLRFQWSPTIGLDDPTNPQPFATPDSTITYRLTVTDTTLSAPCNIAVDDVRIEVLKARLSSDKDTLILPDDSTIQFYNDSQGAIRAEWDFDNGQFSEDYFPQPVIYRKRSYYRVKLTAYGKNGCSDSAFKTVYVKGFPKGRNDVNKNIFIVYPNPAQNELNISYQLTKGLADVTIHVSDLMGRTVENVTVSANSGIITLQTKDWSNGVYLVKITTPNQNVQHFKVVISK